MPEIGNRAPVLYGLFLVGQDKLPFGKLAVRHGLQLVHRCGGKLAHILVHVGHGGKDIFKRCFPAVLGVDRNNAIQSPMVQKQISEKIKQAVQANLFQGAIRELLIPVPTLEEQFRIVNQIETILPALKKLH